MFKKVYSYFKKVYNKFKKVYNPVRYLRYIRYKVKGRASSTLFLFKDSLNGNFRHP